MLYIFADFFNILSQDTTWLSYLISHSMCCTIFAVAWFWLKIQGKVSMYI